MQLISLTSNKESFKTINFKNEFGLNFILATQKKPESSDIKGHTYNGVGKSLIVAIIHFCLGSSKKDGFKDNLPGWMFSLHFKIGANQFVSERSTENQNKIKLNGEEYSIKKFTQILEDMLFVIPKGTDQLTFRSLLPFFIRPRKSSYATFNNPNAINNIYQIQIINSLLLGLDVIMVEEKYTLRNEKERIKNLVKELGKDQLLKDFFLGKKDLSLAQQEIEENITKIEKDLKSFEVAEDYYEIKTQADEIKTRIDYIQNQKVLFSNQIKNIDETRKISPDIKKETINTIYKEASVAIKEETLKSLDELYQFYEHISSSREKRLLDQRNQIQRKLEEANNEVTSLSKELDSKLQYLNAHQALDIFVEMTNQLANLKSKKENIERYENLLSDYKKAKLDLEQKFIESTKKAGEYIEGIKDAIKTTTEFFRELSKRFYPHASAGITIYNNENDNQIRFDIDAKIELDNSDGINNIKIFCYDLTLLLRGCSHKVNFLFHDSRLLSDIDPRQTAEIFKTLNEYIVKSNKQYILSINQNQLDELKKNLTEEEVANIIEKNICLELKDETPSDKLLGIQVDMEYS